MLKKHTFLTVAIATIGLMLVLGIVKVVTKPKDPVSAAAGLPKGGPGGRPGMARGTTVTAAAASPRTFSERIEVLGAAKARQSITVTAPASQLVTRINFQSGQHVAKGQVLAELNAAEQDAAIIQARSQMDLAKRNWDRWKSLSDRGLAPTATTDQAKAQYDQAVATVAASRARAGDRIIRAPFSGVVGLTDAAPGMLLQAGAQIATLDDLSAIRLDFPIPERLVSLLRVGLPIKATADAFPGETFDGRVAQIDTRLDTASRAIQARAEFPNPGGRLRPGMLMRVTIDQGTRTNPSVPESAVTMEGGESFVLLIKRKPPVPPRPGQPAPPPPKPGDQPALMAEKRAVQAGVRREGFIEILSGLAVGDRVVADGTNRVRAGDTINVGNVGPRPAAPGAPGAAAPAAAPAGS